MVLIRLHVLSYPSQMQMIYLAHRETSVTEYIWYTTIAALRYADAYGTYENHMRPSRTYDAF
jgi:hypothetical protein